MFFSAWTELFMEIELENDVFHNICSIFLW